MRLSISPLLQQETLGEPLRFVINGWGTVDMSSVITFGDVLLGVCRELHPMQFGIFEILAEPNSIIISFHSVDLVQM